MRTAARILNPEDRNLDLLCVVPPYNRKDETASRECHQERTLIETTRILEQARGLLAPDARAVNLVPEFGSPAVVIADKTASYDLTVVGARGVGFRSEAGLGPVANRVAEHARGPVLVGRALQSDEGCESWLQWMGLRLLSPRSRLTFSNTSNSARKEKQKRSPPSPNPTCASLTRLQEIDDLQRHFHLLHRRQHSIGSVHVDPWPRW
jgi:hypothetical protein